MTVDYLRISVTDRCNLRCIYCNPSGDNQTAPPEETLTCEEIRRLAWLFVARGVTRVRLTGGEPLLRDDIVKIVAELAPIEGIRDLAMTTNGLLLPRYAASLRRAGLHRVNVSVDSVDPDDYTTITGADLLSRVLAGIEHALDAGLKPVKLNAVILKGVNESQVLPLVDFGRRHGLIVRFIEYAPTDRSTRAPSDYVPTAHIRSIVEGAFGRLTTLIAPPGGGPAVYYRLPGGETSVGFISGRSSIFCRTCSRIRLTSRGHLRPCLYSSHTCDLRTLLRGGADDNALLAAIDAVCAQKKVHTKATAGYEEFLMRNVGG